MALELVRLHVSFEFIALGRGNLGRGFFIPPALLLQVRRFGEGDGVSTLERAQLAGDGIEVVTVEEAAVEHDAREAVRGALGAAP